MNMHTHPRYMCIQCAVSVDQFAYPNYSEAVWTVLLWSMLGCVRVVWRLRYCTYISTPYDHYILSCNPMRYWYSIPQCVCCLCSGAAPWLILHSIVTSLCHHRRCCTLIVWDTHGPEKAQAASTVLAGVVYVFNTYAHPITYTGCHSQSGHFLSRPLSSSVHARDFPGIV